MNVPELIYSAFRHYKVQWRYFHTEKELTVQCMMLPWCLNAAVFEDDQPRKYRINVSSILTLTDFPTCQHAITQNCKTSNRYTALYSSSVICYLCTDFNKKHFHTCNTSLTALKFRLQVSAIQTYYIYKISSDITLQDVKKSPLSKFCHTLQGENQTSKFLDSNTQIFITI